MIGRNNKHGNEPRSPGWEGDCFACGVNRSPFPGEMCPDCGADHPDHVKNGWYDTWSDERKEAFDHGTA